MFIRALGLIVGLAFLWVAIQGTIEGSFEGESAGTLMLGVAFVGYGLFGQKLLERHFPAYSEKYKKKKAKKSQTTPEDRAAQP